MRTNKLHPYFTNPFTNSSIITEDMINEFKKNTSTAMAKVDPQTRAIPADDPRHAPASTPASTTTTTSPAKLDPSAKYIPPFKYRKEGN